MKTLAYNRKAKYDYEILEKFEAGLVLTGQEVKSVKLGHMSLKGAYVTITASPRLRSARKGDEAYLINANIPPYQPKNVPSDYNPSRTRKLLLKSREIKNLIGKVAQGKLTLVPIRVYTKNDKIKLEFGTAKGRKKVDKRELIKEREAKRKMERAMKGDAGFRQK